MALRKAIAALAALAFLGVEASRCQPHPSQSLSTTESIVATSTGQTSTSDAVSTSGASTSSLGMSASTTGAISLTTSSEATSSTALLSTDTATSSTDVLSSTTETISLSTTTVEKSTTTTTEATSSEAISSATTLSTIVSTTLSTDSTSVDTSTTIITTTGLPTTTVTTSTAESTTTTAIVDTCPADNQYVRNPGFDQATLDWTNYPVGFDDFTFPEASNNALSPPGIMKFGVSGTDYDAAPRISQDLRCLEFGRDYSLTFWFLTVQFNTPQHQCDFVPFLGEYALSTMRVQATHAGVWTKYQESVEAPATDAKLEIRIWCEELGSGPGGPPPFVALVDDVNLVRFQ